VRDNAVTLRTLPEKDPQTHPKQGSGPVRSVADLIDDLYSCLQLGVADYGGIDALACSMGKSKGDVSLRVRRAEDSHKQVQRASLDMLSHVAEDPAARHTVVCELLRRWGYKQPERNVEPTPEEKLQMLISRLEGASGDAILKDAAEAAGWDPAVFRRK
jgi:hypothetical protein